ncbi:MAG: S9 family peptidase [Acidobacteriaceae bacterium]
MLNLRLSISAAVLLASLIPAIAQDSQISGAARPMTFSDMMKLRRLSDPVISPESKWVVYSAVDVSLAQNTRQSHLWIVPLAGGAARPLSPAVAERCRFSPDGKSVLFISGGQVEVDSFDSATGSLGGNPHSVTSLSGGADGALWFPDSNRILFTSEVYPSCKDDVCNKQRDDERTHSKVKAQVFDRLLYRHWTAFTRNKRTHLFSVDLHAGTPKDLTPGDHDVPPFNLGGQDFYAISPDGKEIAYTSNIDEVEATSTNNEIFIQPSDGSAPARKISSAKGSDANPLYSPDGKYIAWRSQERGGYESDRFRLMLYDRASGAVRELTVAFPNWVDSFTWHPDSKRIVFVSDKEGEAPLFTLDIESKKIVQASGKHNDEVSVSADGKTVVFSRMSAQFPNEVFRGDLSADGNLSSEQNLSHANDAVLAQLYTSAAESFWFVGSQKVKVQGFIVRPPGFDPNKRYPLKFLIHGGPEGAWGDSWSFRWNPELFAANGYVVVMVNPRGSVGYGQSFIDDVNGDWGGRAYQDLMRGLDYAEGHYPFIDKSRECVLGASYGGYMTNWIITHNHRFKCAVSHDGMFNTESAYGTTEELWFNEWEFKGEPWTNRALYRKWSPHLFVTSIKTPTLVVHSQLDYRLDVSEGFQLFTTLQRLKVPSKMLYFPDEGHWILKPQNSELWYTTVNDWVDQYTKVGTR